MNRVVFGVGRFNPPTIGHEFLINEVKRIASDLDATPLIFVIDGEKSGNDLVKNPLPGEIRKNIISQLYGIRVEVANSAYEVLEIIDVCGFDPKVFVCGSDRVKQYESMVKYSGFLCKVHGIDRKFGKYSLISGTSARKAARENTFDDFKSFMSPSMSDNLIMQVMKCIREPGVDIHVDGRHKHRASTDASQPRNRQ